MVFLAILRLIIQLWLLGLFLHFFGHPAVKRYQEQKVLVVSTRRETKGTQAPALTFVASGKDTKTGWKKKVKGWAGFVQTLCKGANTTEIIVSCIEQETYNLSDITERGAIIKGYSDKVKDPNWTEDFSHTYAGRTFTLDPSMKLRPFSWSENKLRIGLKINLNYEIYIHDPKFFYVTRNPEPGHPSFRDDINSEKLPYVYAFALTEVEEINVPDDPCNEDSEYNFRQCIKESFARSVGCKTKWDNIQNDDLPLCASIKQFKYIHIYLFCVSLF